MYLEFNFEDVFFLSGIPNSDVALHITRCDVEAAWWVLGTSGCTSVLIVDITNQWILYFYYLFIFEKSLFWLMSKLEGDIKMKIKFVLHQDCG